MKLKPGYLTQAEVLDRTKITAKTFRRWLAAGLLSPVTVDGHKCYPEEIIKLIDLIKRSKVRPLAQRAKLFSMPVIEEIEIYTEVGPEKVQVVANLVTIKRNGVVYEHKRLRDGSYLTLIKHIREKTK